MLCFNLYNSYRELFFKKIVQTRYEIEVIFKNIIF